MAGSVFAFVSNNLQITGTIAIDLSDSGFTPPPIDTSTPPALLIPVIPEIPNDINLDSYEDA